MTPNKKLYIAMFAICLLCNAGTAFSKEYSFKSDNNKREKIYITIPDSWTVDAYDNKKDAITNSGGFESRALLQAYNNTCLLSVNRREAISDNQNARSFKLRQIFRGKIDFAPAKSTLIRTDIPDAPKSEKCKLYQYFKCNDGSYFKALIIAKNETLYTIYAWSKTEDFSRYDEIFDSVKVSLDLLDKYHLTFANSSIFMCFIYGILICLGICAILASITFIRDKIFS